MDDMDKDGGFSIISVDSQDDDEIVIRVGVPKSEGINALSEKQSKAAGSERKNVASEEAEKNPSSPKHSVDNFEGDDFKRANVDQLDERGPFPKARIAVILSALALLAGVIIFYFLSY